MGENDVRLVSIVDDDGSLRRSVRNLLTSVGFRVETFVSAEAFLDSVHRENTGCLVLDLQMPGMTGLDLLAHLSATDSRIPAIVLTAHGDDEARRRTMQAGLDWSPRLKDPALQAELRTVLTAAIEALPEEYRTVMLLHDAEGLSSPEIAEALQIKLGTIKSRVHRARLFLRSRLADYMERAPESP